MSEEEKKAIEKALWHLEKVLIRKDDIDQYAVILDYIEKQQKEIDKLKKDKDILYGVIDELKGVKNE